MLPPSLTYGHHQKQQSLCLFSLHPLKGLNHGLNLVFGGDNNLHKYNRQLPVNQYTM